MQFRLSVLIMCIVLVSASTSLKDGKKTSRKSKTQLFANYQIGNGEYQNFLIDLDGTPYGIGGNLITLGSGGVGLPGGANKILLNPTNLKFNQIAGVLHGGMGVDVNGNVWTWGDGTGGQIGNGQLPAHVTTPVQIMTDNSSQPFTNIKFVVSGLGVGVPCFAVKQDGTLWGWGGLTDGFAGDGTAGRLQINPVQIPVPGVPGSFKVKSVVALSVIIVLRDDGAVFTAGGNGGNEQDLGYHKARTNDYMTLHQLTQLTNIAQIAGGAAFNYALHSNGTLFGWGYYGHHLGFNCGYCPIPYPTALWSVMNAFPAGTSIAQISTNHIATYAILNDGSLWGWGDNAQGSLGIGCELEFLDVSGRPYSWDFGQMDFPVYTPVRIVPERSDFVGLSSGMPFVFYKNAITADNTIYAMGRNKGGVIGNGVLACSSDQDANYPNAHDVTLATIVNPLALTSADIVIDTMPYCALRDRNYAGCAVTACNQAGIVFGADRIPLNFSGTYTPGCSPNFGRTGRCHTTPAVNAICPGYNNYTGDLTSDAIHSHSSFIHSIVVVMVFVAFGLMAVIMA